MHVGLIGPNGADLFLNNIGDTLLQMGHQVAYLGSTYVRGGGRLGTRVGQLALTTSPGLEARYHERLAGRALRCQCDVVISAEGALSPAAVAALRRGGVPVALWFPDAISNLGRARMLAAPYTAIFFKDPLLVRRVRDTLGLPVFYLPEACNPRFHRPIGDAGSLPTIVVVGNTYVTRLLLIRRLHDAGIPLTIYGGATPRWGRSLLPPELQVRPPVFREAKSRIFRSAAGVLNNLHPAEMYSVNCRLFEATAAGAAVLCERRPALADLYDLDREVLPFGDFAELVDRAKALLADPQLTTDIGDAASKRAHAEHTYEARLSVILEKLV